MGIIDRDGALYWATGIDTSGMQADAQKVGKIFNEIGKDAVKASDMSYKASLELRKHLERKRTQSRYFKLNKTTYEQLYY